MILVIAIDSYL